MSPLLQMEALYPLVASGENTRDTLQPGTLRRSRAQSMGYLSEVSSAHHTPQRESRYSTWAILLGQGKPRESLRKWRGHYWRPCPGHQPRANLARRLVGGSLPHRKHHTNSSRKGKHFSFHLPSISTFWGSRDETGVQSLWGAGEMILASSRSILVAMNSLNLSEHSEYTDTRVYLLSEAAGGKRHVGCSGLVSSKS